MCTGLLARGVGPGDRVVWQSDATEEAVLRAALAILRLGAALVPVSAAQSELERRIVIEDVDPALVVAPEGRHDGHEATGCAPGELRTEARPLPPTSPAPASIALIIYTSGTTGRPKGAMLTHAQPRCGDRRAHRSVGTCPAAIGWSRPCRSSTSTASWSRSSASVLPAAPSICRVASSSSASSRRQRSPRRQWPSACRRCCTGSQGREIPGSWPDCGSSSRGRRRCPSSSSRTFERRAGLRILERYGMTETLLTISNPLDGPRRSGTVGVALPGVTLALPAPGAPEAELKVAGPDGLRRLLATPRRDGGGPRRRLDVAPATSSSSTRRATSLSAVGARS